jgi:type I restriction enzyme S subunit
LTSKWPTSKLGKIATVGAGNSAPQDDDSFSDSGPFFIRTSDVGRIKNGEISESHDRLNPNVAKRFRKFRSGTVLMPKSGASTFNNNRVITTIDAHVSSHLATIEANEEILNDRFVWYYLTTVKAQDLMQDQAYPSLSLKQINDIEIPLPPLDEQKRIVVRLDKALSDLDKLVSGAKTTLRDLDALYDQELIKKFESLTDAVSTRAVSEVTNRITNGYVGPIKDVYVEEGIPYLLARHIRDNKLEFDGRTFINAEFNAKNSKSILKVDDVLLVQSGHIGHSAVVGKSHEGHNCHALIVLTPAEQVLAGSYLSLFFTYCLAAGNFADLRSGSTVPHLTCKEIRKMQIPLPPINQQKEFVDHLSVIRDLKDDLVTKTKCKVEELEKLRASMLSAAFVGDF